MTPIADMVREMLAREVSGDIIVLAVEAAERAAFRADIPQNSADKTAERRRAKDRDRKRLLRGIPQNSADIPPNSADAHNLTSSQQKDSIEKEEKKLRTRKTLLSAEFQPKPAHFDAAKRLGYPNPEQAVAEKFEDMRLWAESKGVMRPGWDATLHGFLRRDAPKGRQTNAKAQSGLSATLARLRDDIAADERGQEGRGPPPRLLSNG